jgi:Tfp pilus assembly protein PilO
VTLSDRDRKLALVIIPIFLLVAYWFLLLAPKREASASASKDLSEQTQRLEQARTAANTARQAKTNFAADYAEIVRLGKAIPAGVDMPSLVVQLDRAAAGTGIRFTRVATGERDPAAAAPAPAPAPSGSSSSSSSSSTPVQAGGETAQSAPGGAVEAANNTSAQQSQQAQAASQSGVASSDTQTSTSSGGGLPIGGGAGAPGTPTAAAAPALDTVPLELEFVGNFFNLSDFFHDIKRFVHVANRNVVVSGRLVTIEGVKFSSDPELFPRIKAEVTATVYLSPKVQGATAGATAAGPAPATGATPTPASTTTPSTTPSPAPTATATP